MENIFSKSSQEFEDYYALLGCTELSSIEQIDTEYKLRAKECHPDKILDHEQKIQAETTFMRLNKAHSVLKDPETREAYDRWKRSGLSVSFEQFLSIQSRCQPSMHWATEKKQPSITDNEKDEPQKDLYSNASTSTVPTVQSDHHLQDFRGGKQDDLLKKFRSYQL